jgi:hypothetical protein
MSRRFRLALGVAAFAAATLAYAGNAPAIKTADRACPVDGTEHLVPSHDELTALFARPEPQLTVTKTGTAAPMGPPEVLVARVGADGKIAIVCVDNEEAARHFLDAPVESLSRKKEQ